MKTVDIKDILFTISTWEVEASSAFNDGYIRTHYLHNLEKIQEALNRSKKPKVVT